MKKGDEEDSEDEERPEESSAFAEPAPVVDTKHRYFIGKDYSNPYERDFETLDRYSEGKSPVHVDFLLLLYENL